METGLQQMKNQDIRCGACSRKLGSGEFTHLK